MTDLPKGVSCTMLMPYTAENRPDFGALDAMVRWYAAKGCASLFAMCQSTEMSLLSAEERLAVIRRVRENAGRGTPVLATGTFSDDIAEIAESSLAVREAGADAVVMLTNRLDPKNGGGGALIKNAERLMGRLPEDITLGFYECPLPYKRLLTAEELRWAASTGKIRFLKDTCCDPDMLRERLDIVRDTPLKLFNANAQTLLLSLRYGAAGYSGVMANIQPELFVWLCDNFKRYPEQAERLQQVLCFCAFSESLSYPLTAKYAMRREGVPVEINSRMRGGEEFTPYHAHIMDQLLALTRHERERLPRK